MFSHRNRLVTIETVKLHQSLPLEKKRNLSNQNLLTDSNLSLRSIPFHCLFHDIDSFSRTLTLILTLSPSHSPSSNLLKKVCLCLSVPLLSVRTSDRKALQHLVNIDHSRFKKAWKLGMALWFRTAWFWDIKNHIFLRACERTNDWAQRGGRAKLVVRRKQKSERCEQTDKRVAQHLRPDYWIILLSMPPCVVSHYLIT